MRELPDLGVDSICPYDEVSVKGHYRILACGRNLGAGEDVGVG